MRYTEQSHTQVPGSLPVSLEVKQVSVAHLLALVALALGLLLLASLVVYLGLVWPDLSPLSLVVSLPALALSGLVVWLVAAELRARLRYHNLITEWHYAALERYQSGQADAVSTTTATLDMSADNPAHVLLVALWLHQRIQLGATPSVRVLEGPLFLAGRRVGDLSRDTSQAMLNLFAQRGLIAGRGPRAAGTWSPSSADEILELILEHP